MYKFRVLECPANREGIPHPETDSEFDAKQMAQRIVSETHNACVIERFNGQRWERGSITYRWLFERVCFYNHR